MQTTESSVQNPYSQSNVPNSLNATSTLVSQEGILGGGSGGGGLKTSIKQANTQTTTFKGINIMSMEDGKGLKFLDQAKKR